MLASLYGVLNGLLEQLSEYEDALIQLNQLATELKAASEQVENLKELSMEILAVDDKPYKEELIDSAKKNVENAHGYIIGTAIPKIKKKIQELKKEIAKVREEIARLEEEERAREAEKNNNQ